MSHRRLQSRNCRAWAPALVVSTLYMCLPTHAAVIIQQYIEGSSFNKAVIFANSGSSAIVRSFSQRLTRSVLHHLQAGKDASACGERHNPERINRL